jgi:chemotaxis protein CheZ
MSNFTVLKTEYTACVEALTEALRAGDEPAFFAAVDHMLHMREPAMMQELRSVTGDLQRALERFGVESRLQDIAANEIPDARARLTYVLSMTEQAAHRTLDLVEDSAPLAEQSARAAVALARQLSALRDGSTAPSAALPPLLASIERFLPQAEANCERIRRNLADVLLAQGYQDLAGQIIRNVMQLVEELDGALAALVRLSGDVVEHATLGNSPSSQQGPTVPGIDKAEVASAQSDVDDLLSSLGI